MTLNNSIKQPLIIPLDVSSRSDALLLVDALGDSVGMFKIGSQLFTSAGPDLVREIVDRGVATFLDLKFHDIPNTVSSAAIEAAKLGVSMMTIHAAGGPDMINVTMRALDEEFGDRRPMVVAITVLTSISADNISLIGGGTSVENQVVRLARMSHDNGVDGWVCSPHEITMLRQEFGNHATIVTPGVRMKDQPFEDQQRVATPREAIAAGADYIVIGRPITRAQDPIQEVQKVIRSLGVPPSGEVIVDKESFEGGPLTP